MGKLQELLKFHTGALIFSAIVLVLGGIYGYHLGGTVTAVANVMFIMLVLAVLEISLSFDNAVVNAKVLAGMDEIWRKRFLTWGMLFAVGFMRLVFPILIVSIAGGVGVFEAVSIAINDQDKYSALLQSSHILIAGFGGAFLFLVGLDFFFDAEKDVHWVKIIEEKLSKLGERKSISIVITLLIMYYFTTILPVESANTFFMAGIFGIITHEIVKLIGDLMESGDSDEVNLTGTVAKSGLAGFLYLEVLDASFSFDGVLGALVISKDIFIIMGGLAIGAYFVRSITLQLLKSGTLAEYKYLEHGAFAAILCLATIMFTSTLIHIPELVTGILSVGFILLGYYSSVKENRES